MFVGLSIFSMPRWETWQPTPVFSPGETPWTEEPGGLRFMGSQRARHDWATKHILSMCSYLWPKYITETWVTNKNEIPLELHGFHKVGVLVENRKQFSILETCPKQRSVALEYKRDNLLFCTICFLFCLHIILQ